MKTLLFLLSACLMAQTGAPDLITGTWINENHETPGVTQLVVRRDGSRTIVHAWGSCTPVDCDWGEADAELWNGIPLVIWKHGFSDVRMELVPQPDGRLVGIRRSEYHDNSGRTDSGHAEFYARQESKPDSPETVAARALLKTVAETYRSLRNVRLESASTENRKTARSEIRSQSSGTLFYAAPDHARYQTPRSTVIADGTNQWEIYPEANDYTRQPQPKDLAPRFLSYTLLDTTGGVPILAPRAHLDDADCSVVRIDFGRGVKQELWIDDATHLVRKDIFEDPSTTRQTLFRVARLESAFDPALFTYDPEKTHAVNRRQAGREAPVTLVGAPAPDFSLTDLAGRQVSLAGLRGKVVLLDFWGTWCGYCREALPSIELLHRSAGSKGLAVFGIDSEAAELARDYVAKYHYSFPTLLDARDTIAGKYLVNGWPTTVLIDREGKVAFYSEGTEPEKLRDALLKLGIW